MSNNAKRERLIDSASELFHRFGIASTSLADIAKHADIPIGNVYYYFKTKEELALAALEKRQQLHRDIRKKLDETFDDPRQRLIEALRFYDSMKDDYSRFGCPLGKIIIESDPQQDNVARTAAQTLMEFVEWASSQFVMLGHEEQARSYALSLVAGLQGGVIIAKATRDPSTYSGEVDRLVQWVGLLPNRRIHLGKVPVRQSA
jgi:TetR/AcrR family transcriptional repressor of nem operon